jgi:hypothetical protein
MSSLTEIRVALADALSDLPERVNVISSGGSYDDGSDKLLVQIVVGEPSPGAEARVDELLDPDGGARAMLEADADLSGLVSGLHVPSHAGHRSFDRPDKPPLLGTELTVQIYR